MLSKSRFLNVPVEPFVVEPGLTAEQILERMEKISFQGRNLAAGYRVWLRMLESDATIFLGAAGALSAGGLRLVLAHLISNRYVDCLVSTGAILYHDLHETRGRRHFIGSPDEDDEALKADHVDRVYDTFVSEDEFVENDAWIAQFVATLAPRPLSTREFLYRLGEHLWKETGREGILTAAYRANVPVFCPAIADSSIGMGISEARHEDRSVGYLDTIADIIELTNIVIRRQKTASIVLGGGTPKNFINQARVQAECFRPGIGGHECALQIITDSAQWGGLSGSSLNEAASWGKLSCGAERVTVHADVTIVLPLLVTALSATAGRSLAARQAPVFDLAGRVMLVDGVALPDNRFEEFE
jgi:deoxyhypusine synthase